MVGINVPIRSRLPTTRSAAGRRASSATPTSTGRRGSAYTRQGRHLALARPGHLEGRPGLPANARNRTAAAGVERAMRTAAPRCPRSPPRSTPAPSPVRTCAERIEAGDAPIPFPRPRAERLRRAARLRRALHAHACRARPARRGRPLLGQGRRARPPAGRCILSCPPAPRDARPPLRARRRRRAGRPDRAVRPATPPSPTTAWSGR